MRIELELFGLSRLIVGAKSLSLEIDEGSTFADIVRVLAGRYPGMIGDVIQEDHKSLQAPNIMNLNAKRMVQPENMGDIVSDGDQIILMSMSAGG
jgi:molybdopterin converting factor small subunit